MRRTMFVAVTVALLAACTNEETTEPTVKVFKSSGSVQCGGGTITPPEIMQKELTDAGIEVKSFGCGNDGGIHPAMCGESDGGINIFEIPHSRAPKAQALGFKDLSAWPNARFTQCM